MCIFCDIISGKIPSYTLYEDETVIAFLDISQVTKGHTLVVPKKHYDNFITCDKKTLLHVMDIAQMLSEHLMTTLSASGMNILSNVNEVAGQSVPHFHLHLIPRYHKEDSYVIMFNESESQDLGSLSKSLQIKEVVTK